MVHRMTKRVEMVPNWKRSWKWASIQISAIGVILLGMIELISNSVIALPPHILKEIPHGSTIALVLFVLNIVGRLVRLSSDDEEPKDGGK